MGFDEKKCVKSQNNSYIMIFGKYLWTFSYFFISSVFNSSFFKAYGIQKIQQIIARISTATSSKITI